MQKPVVSTIFLALLCAGSSPAQQAVLNLRELVEEALRVNPEVRAAQKRYEALRQRPPQAGSLPDPMFSVGYTAIGNPRPVAGLGSQPMARAGFMVSQEFPFPGKRGLQTAIAGKEAEEALQDYRAAALSVASRMKQAYHRLYHTAQMLRVLDISRSQIEAVADIAEIRYATGRAAQQDILRAHTQLAILETRRTRLGQMIRAAEAELNTLLARPPDSPLGSPGEIPPGALSITVDQLEALAAENSPLLGRGRRSIDKAQLSLNLARKDYYPDTTLSGGYYYQGGIMPAMYELRVDFKLPAWFWRKQRAAVAEQANTVSQSHREYEAAAQALAYQIRESFLAAEASSRLMKLYAETVIPQAGLALESSLASYQTGAIDFSAVLANLTTKIEYEENYHQEMLAFHLALIRLEELTGSEWMDSQRGENK